MLHRQFEMGDLMEPATIGLISLGVSAIGTVGGLIQGNQAAENNKRLADQQEAQIRRANQYAEQLANSADEARYRQMANEGVMGVMQDLNRNMQAAGMGDGSTAALTQLAQAAGQIRAQYDQSYMGANQQALSGAASIMQGGANTPRMGYDANPYAGFQGGLKGIADWAANNYYGVGKGSLTNPAPGVGQPTTAKPSLGTGPYGLPTT
jgi:hypothetical protein